MLGTQLASFLVLNIEYGLTGLLNLIVFCTGQYEQLQSANDDALSHLFAKQAENFVTFDPALSAGISFFKNATRSSDSARLLSLFKQTIQRLASKDVIMCLWLFLQTAEDRKCHRGLHRLVHRRDVFLQGLIESYNSYMVDDSIPVAVSFLYRCPYAVFLAPLRIALSLNKKAERASAKVEERYHQACQHVENESRRFEEESKRRKAVRIRLGLKLKNTFRACRRGQRPICFMD